MERTIERAKMNSLVAVRQLAEYLVTHASTKHGRSRYSGYPSFSDVNSYIAALQMDGDGHYCKCDKCNGTLICNGLRNVAGCLTSIKGEMEKLLPS